MLVHEAVAPGFLPRMIARFRQAQVELRGCPRTREIDSQVSPAQAEDWGRNFWT